MEFLKKILECLYKLKKEAQQEKSTLTPEKIREKLEEIREEIGEAIKKITPSSKEDPSKGKPEQPITVQEELEALFKIDNLLEKQINLEKSYKTSPKDFVDDLNYSIEQLSSTIARMYGKEFIETPKFEPKELDWETIKNGKPSTDRVADQPWSEIMSNDEVAEEETYKKESLTPDEKRILDALRRSSGLTASDETEAIDMFSILGSIPRILENIDVNTIEGQNTIPQLIELYESIKNSVNRGELESSFELTNNIEALRCFLPRSIKQADKDVIVHNIGTSYIVRKYLELTEKEQGIKEIIDAELKNNHPSLENLNKTLKQQYGMTLAKDEFNFITMMSEKVIELSDLGKKLRAIAHEEPSNNAIQEELLSLVEYHEHLQTFFHFAIDPYINAERERVATYSKDIPSEDDILNDIEKDVSLEWVLLDHDPNICGEEVEALEELCNIAAESLGLKNYPEFARKVLIAWFRVTEGDKITLSEAAEKHKIKGLSPLENSIQHQNEQNLSNDAQEKRQKLVKEFAESNQDSFIFKDLRNTLKNPDGSFIPSHELVEACYKAGYWYWPNSDFNSGIKFYKKDRFKSLETYTSPLPLEPQHIEMFKLIQKNKKITFKELLSHVGWTENQKSHDIKRDLQHLVYRVDGQFHFLPWITDGKTAEFKKKSASYWITPVSIETLKAIRDREATTVKTLLPYRTGYRPIDIKRELAIWGIYPVKGQLHLPPWLTNEKIAELEKGVLDRIKPISIGILKTIQSGNAVTLETLLSCTEGLKNQTPEDIAWDLDGWGISPSAEQIHLPPWLTDKKIAKFEKAVVDKKLIVDDDEASNDKPNLGNFIQGQGDTPNNPPESRLDNASFHDSNSSLLLSPLNKLPFNLLTYPGCYSIQILQHGGIQQLLYLNDSGQIETQIFYSPNPQVKPFDISRQTSTNTFHISPVSRFDFNPITVLQINQNQIEQVIQFPTAQQSQPRSLHRPIPAEAPVQKLPNAQESCNEAVLAWVYTPKAVNTTPQIMNQARIVQLPVQVPYRIAAGAESFNTITQRSFSLNTSKGYNGRVIPLHPNNASSSTPTTQNTTSPSFTNSLLAKGVGYYMIGRVTISAGHEIYQGVKGQQSWSVTAHNLADLAVWVVIGICFSVALPKVAILAGASIIAHDFATYILPSRHFNPYLTSSENLTLQTKILQRDYGDKAVISFPMFSTASHMHIHTGNLSDAQQKVADTYHIPGMSSARHIQPTRTHYDLQLLTLPDNNPQQVATFVVGYWDKNKFHALKKPISTNYQDLRFHGAVKKTDIKMPVDDKTRHVLGIVK